LRRNETEKTDVTAEIWLAVDQPKLQERAAQGRVPSCPKTPHHPQFIAAPVDALKGDVPCWESDLSHTALRNSD